MQAFIRIPHISAPRRRPSMPIRAPGNLSISPDIGHRPSSSSSPAAAAAAAAAAQLSAAPAAVTDRRPSVQPLTTPRRPWGEGAVA